MIWDFLPLLWTLVSCNLRYVGTSDLQQDDVVIFDYNSFLRQPFKKVNSRSKVEVLGTIFKRHIKELRAADNNHVDIVFLVDSSTSVGKSNFVEEIKFVKKLLSDFTVDKNQTRVSVITFSSRERVIRQIDYLNDASPDRHKCSLLEEDLPRVTYNGGGTYTLGAFLEAREVLKHGRPEAKKAVFLITDGFSNGGDPTPQARALKEEGVKIYTFGIQNGNIRELLDMASDPKNESCYILNSFEEFEALAKRALHEDLNSGRYIRQPADKCSRLCIGGDCCDDLATCHCGIHTGKYECICPAGHYGNGLRGGCHKCPSGTYKGEAGSGDVSTCHPCPDENHVTEPGAVTPEACFCKIGYRVFNETGCAVLHCPMIEVPKSGYFVNNKCKNVFNAACGVQCNPGFQLRGSSLRICQEDGTWSGSGTECIMKTCPALMTPKNGNMICSSDDFTFNTVCRFTCDTGYKLVGSRKRTCLAIAFWTGINTRCREITCQPLPIVRDGSIYPAACTTSEVSFGTTCSVTCHPGYSLVGPHSKQCLPDGMWMTDSDGEVSLCVDTAPPFIMCPYDIDTATDEDQNTAEISWEVPLAVDNSGYVPVLSAEPAVTPPTQFPIGTTKVTYIAQDLNKNKAECAFYITVKDLQTPQIDRCYSPLPIVSPEPYAQVAWEEPLFSDNSEEEVTVKKSHSQGLFPKGQTKVIYVATDLAGNNSTCEIVISVIPHPCVYPPVPVNGIRECHENDEGVYCSFSCMEGFAFAIPPAEVYICAYDNVWEPRDRLPIPDCSAGQLSNDLVQPASLTFAGDISCRKRVLLNTIETIFEDKLSRRVNELCIEDISCQVEDIQTTCQEEDGFNKVRVVLGRKRRGTRRHRRSTAAVEKTTSGSSSKADGGLLTFDFNLEGSVDTSGDPREDKRRQQQLSTTLQNIIETIKTEAKRGEFNVDIANSHLQLSDVNFDTTNPQFKCKQGSILVNTSCVNCPVGTFFNVMSERCESCGRGAFQPLEGQVTCLVCPDNTSTTDIHARSREDCKALCLPGSFSVTGLEMCETCQIGFYQSEYGQISCKKCPPRTTTRRRGSRYPDDCQEKCTAGHVSKNGLQPCFPCPKGSYQPEKGRSTCLECPGNAMTNSVGSSLASDCLGAGMQADAPPFEFEQQTVLADECSNEPCLNGGSCKSRPYAFVCECLPGYAGTYCEEEINECEVTPCLNEGTCVDNIGDYNCLCTPGFTGKKCELNMNDCGESPCLNGATCVDQVDGYSCTCDNGYEGKHCEVNIDDCATSPCLNGGTCEDEVAGYSCVCPPGVQGLSCEIQEDDCSSGPCNNGATCVDLIAAFRCVCLPGFTGTTCDSDINECESYPCVESATCVDMPGDFECICPSGFSGKNCSHEIDIYFQLDFPSTASTTDYAKADIKNDLTAVTVCFWMKTDDTQNQGTPFSYATSEHDNALTLSDYDGFVFYVNGEKVSTYLQVNDGLWHHICVMWSSNRGAWKIYMDGFPEDSAINLANGQILKGGGVFVIGQEQDSLGGGFSTPESFIGTITQLNVWSEELSFADIDNLRVSCEKNLGDVIAWPDVVGGIKGSLSDTPIDFCQECPIPSKPDYGSVDYSGLEAGSTASYTCLHGFRIAGPAERLCLVTGEWEGQVPTCQRVQCGYPGNIDNGYFSGTDYTFDYTVRYKCNKGFNLVGEKTRYCNANGRWEGEQPVCEQIRCQLPQLSENTRVVGGTAASVLPGVQVQFECTPGNRMYTEHDSVYCQRDGTWDKSIPTCDPQSCTAPPIVENARASNAENIVEFNVGFTAIYKCDFGYNLVQNSANPTGQLSCLPSGDWQDNLPECTLVECQVPPYIPNGNADYSELTFLSQATYTCDPGYEIRGESLLECIETGEWDPDPPECAAVSCGRPEDILYGVFNADSYTYSGTVRYQCNPGYQLLGTRVRQCLENATWSGEPPVCKPVSCGKPESIENGILIGREYTLGNTVTYECIEGFTLIGIAERICRETGKWQNDVPSCNKIECVSPPAVRNAYYTESSFFFQDSVEYQCEEGYRMEGQSTLTCQSNKQWSPVAPSCLPIECSQLDGVEHGEVIVEELTFNSRATYLCSEGYDLVGDVERTCKADSTWSGEIPECKPILCYPPRKIPNGEVDYKDIELGSVVRYMCDDGFFLVGEEVRRCLANRSLSEEEPRCQPVVCSELDSIEFGQYTVGALTYQSTATYLCFDGYVLKGASERTCQADATWSGSIPACVPRECDKPSRVISNGRMLGSEFTFGSVISYTCDPGYYITGLRNRTCQVSGEWNYPIPVCNAVECPRPIVRNGFTSSFERGFGTTITYSCRQGYRLVGPLERTCLASGIWSGDQPQCIKYNCPDLLPPANGQVRIRRGNASYECFPGFHLVGAQVRTCQENETWAHDDPICDPNPCTNLTTEPFPNGSLLYSDLTFGSSVAYACDEGYLLSGDRTRDCLIDGTWSGEKPICKLIYCIKPLPVANGRIIGEDYSFGSSIFYQCDTGYSLNGVSERTCTSSGFWSGFLPKCQIVECQRPSSIDNGRVVGASNTYASNITYTCLVGYELVGESTRTCTKTGQWSVDAPTCRRIQCPVPENIPNGNVTTHTLVLGSHIAYECNPGYELSGSQVRLCIATKQWSGSTPVCNKISCGNPPPVLFGSIVGNSWNFGDTINYVCDEGYQFVGDSIKLCTADGLWSGQSPVCAKITCGNPPKILNGLAVLLDRSLDVNTEANLTCIEGYRGVGRSVIVCETSGHWSRTDFECVMVTCPEIELSNGVVLGADYSFNQTIEIICNTGYSVKGSVKLRCLSSGFWSTVEDIECEKVYCDDPGPFENGYISGSNYSYTATVTYFCDESYELVGPSKRVCEGDGYWSNDDPFCRLITCPDPPVVQNALRPDVSTRAFRYGERLTYYCDVGYRIDEGSDGSLLCSKSGQWQGTVPICIKVDCGPFPKVFHSKSSGTSTDYNSIVQYTCNRGFDLKGPSSVQCSESGQWTESPQCVPISCSHPPYVAHTVVVGREYTFQNTIIYICDEGYRLVGEMTHTCEADGQWSGTLPTCQPITCGPPPDVDFAVYHGSSQEFKSIVEYNCNEGYNLEGNYLLECVSSGNWMGTTPVCQPVQCGSPPDIPYARSSADTLHYKSTVFYSCQDGYELIGNNILECTASGLWVGSPPECRKVECGPPPVLPHSSTIVSETTFGSTVSYFCNPGYQLRGRSSAICGPDRTWDYDAGTECLPVDCGEPPGTHSALGPTVTYKDTVFQSIAAYSCPQGYQLSSAGTLICDEHGAWKGQIPDCFPVRCGNPPVSDLVTFEGSVFVYGSVVSYSCPSGYWIVGGPTLVCQADGSWNGEAPQCLRISCGPLRLSEDGLLVSADHRINNHYGDVVSFSCEQGYHLKGITQLTCQSNGSWSGEPPICVTSESLRACNAHTGVPNSKPANNIAIGRSINVTCQEGYVAHGNMTITCMSNATWTPPVGGVCQRVFCGKLQLRDMVNVIRLTGRSYFYGDKIFYKCRPGVPPARSPPAITCQQDSSWDGQPECGATCKLPCQNGGICLGLNRCKCPNGFGGPQCEEAHCILSCLNGGKCVSPYTCQCRPGYHGARCQKAICVNKCQNGGKCVRPNQCRCYNGYQLPFCASRKL